MALDQEAVSFLENKGIKTSFSYKDIWQNEHANNFTVAKIMQADVLQDIKEALVEALKNGKTLKRFKKELKPVLQQKGWFGKKEVKDPKTGETKTTVIDSKRLDLIYNSNKRAARAAGVWDRAQATKEFAPYFRYELGPSRKHREQHASWEGLILPIDSPFWDTNYPPNGYNCKCHVTQITKRQAEREGGASEEPNIEYETYRNVRTEKTSKVPKGVEPSWASNVGKERTKQLNNLLEEKLLEVDHKIANTVIKDCINSSQFKDQLELAKEINEGKFTGNKEQIKQQFLPVALVNNKLQELLNLKQKTLVKFNGFYASNFAKNKLNSSQENYLFLQEVISNFVNYKVTKDTITLYYQNYQVTLQKTKQNELYLTSFLQGKIKNK